MVKVEINPKGVIELFKSPEIQEHLKKVGESVKQSAGDGNYGVQVHNAGFTAICNVYAGDAKTARKTYKNNTLLKALGGLPQKKQRIL